MSSPHTISKESTTAEIARHGTKRPDGKRKRTPQACANVKKSCHRSCSRQTIYPLTEFRSSIPFCFRVALFVLRLAVFVQTFLLFFFFSIFFFPSFLLFTTSTMTFGFGARKRSPFLLSSNTFFVQNYSQQAHASCLKGIATRWSREKNGLSSSARGILAAKQRKRAGRLRRKSKSGVD